MKKLLFILLLLLLPQQAEMATYGYTGLGATAASIINLVTLARFPAGFTENGTGSSITVMVDVSGGDKLIKANVYQDETGELDVDVATFTNGETAEMTVAAGNDQTITFNFNSAPSFVSGTFYRPAVWSNIGASGFSRMNFDSGQASHSAYQVSSTYGTWPNPSGTLTRTDDARVSIYITYTPSTTNTSPKVHISAPTFINAAIYIP